MESDADHCRRLPDDLTDQELAEMWDSRVDDPDDLGPAETWSPTDCDLLFAVSL